MTSGYLTVTVNHSTSNCSKIYFQSLRKKQQFLSSTSPGALEGGKVLIPRAAT